jgi:hypothetical protein
MVKQVTRRVAIKKWDECKKRLKIGFQRVWKVENFIVMVIFQVCFYSPQLSSIHEKPLKFILAKKHNPSIF